MPTMLERIAEAEKQADRMIEEANAAARDQIANAKAEAEDAVAEALKAERQKTADAIAAAEAEGESNAKAILASVDADKAAVRAAALDRLPEAVSYLMERVKATV